MLPESGILFENTESPSILPPRRFLVFEKNVQNTAAFSNQVRFPDTFDRGPKLANIFQVHSKFFFQIPENL